MQFTFAVLALAAAGANAASASYSIVSPTASAPAGCATSYSGSFEITVVLPSASKKRDLVARDTCATDGTLVATLTDGVLTDSKGRIGSIVANHQFQFDGPPPQAGFIYDAGWSVCSNGSLALGGSSVFYQCLSGDFYNLYDESTGSQCEQVIIDIIPCGSSTGASQTSDGQVTAAPATQISDGQVTVASATSAATQISDGQVQASSAVTAVSQISDGQVQASSAVPKPVSQFTDGQIQVTASPVKVSPVATPVAQITDGQIQVTTAVAAAATSASLTTSYGAPVSQISDGQIQATSASNATVKPTAASATPATFTGAASLMTVGAQFIAGAVAVVAIAVL